jgi:hypothetical protein
MALAVGIDLGTTTSVIAAWEGGDVSVVPHAEGARTTPSVVAFTDSGERLVGLLARRQAILDPQGTMYSGKRVIGRRYEEIAQEAEQVTYDVVPDENGNARIKVRGKLHAPEEISALILRRASGPRRPDGGDSWRRQPRAADAGNQPARCLRRRERAQRLGQAGGLGGGGRREGRASGARGPGDHTVTGHTVTDRREEER